MMIRRFSLLVALALCPVLLTAQPVEWENLSLKSPFMLYNNSDLGALQTKVQSDPLGTAFYAQIYQQSQRRSDDQRQRAQIAKSIAFVVAIGRDLNGELSTHMRGELLTVLLEYLSNIDPNIPTNNSEYQWKAIELGQFSQAYDAYRDLVGPVAAVEGLLADFAEEAVTQLEMPLQSHNNLTSKLAGGLGMAALVLNDAQDAAIQQNTGAWMALAREYIDETFFDYHSVPDGWGGYSEGPYYLRYAMMSLLPYFASLSEATQGRDLKIGAEVYTDPLNDPRYHRVIEWAAYLRMPDGRMPAFEDTYQDTYFPELAILGNHSTDGHFFAWQNYNGLTPLSEASIASHLSGTYDFRIEYLRWENGLHAVPDGKPPIRHLPNAGYSVMRSSWANDALYFAMIGKHDKARTGGSGFGSGHKHANETGFMLHSGGQLLAMEPGYYQYSYRDSLIFSQNHNIILVDGKGPDRTTLLNFLIGVDAYIEDTLSGRWGGTSTVRTSYEDADISRTALLLDDIFVVLRDEVQSSSQHTYTHQVHGNGLASAGTFTLDAANHSGTWRADPMKFTAHVGAVDATPTYTAVTRKHSPTYRVFEEHSALYSTVDANDATFFTLLLPSAESASVTVSELISPAGIYAVSGTAGSRPFAAGVNTTGERFELETIVGKAETDASLTAVANDGAFGFHLFLEDITEFTLASIPLFRCDHPATFVGFLTYNEIEGTVYGEDLRELSVFLSYKPDTVIGTGFSSYELQGNRLVMQIPDGRADFQILLTNDPTSAPQLPEAASWHVGAVYPNPTSGAINIPVTGNVSGTIDIALYSVLGDEVHRTERMLHQPGSSVLTLTPPEHLHGPYLLKLNYNGQVSTVPVLLR